MKRILSTGVRWPLELYTKKEEIKSVTCLKVDNAICGEPREIVRF